MKKGCVLAGASQRSNYWRLKYRFQGVEKTLVLEVYPAVSLKARWLLGEDGTWLDEAVIVRLRGDADAPKLLGARIGVVEPAP